MEGETKEKKARSSLEIETIIEGEDTRGTPVSLGSRIEKTRSPRRRSYTMDLRIHSPASLGYFHVKELDTAPALVRLARVKGLDVIAITDFFNSDFVDKVVEAAKGTSLIVIPGVNLRCQVGACSEVVLTCLFPEKTTSAHLKNFLSRLKVPESAAGSEAFVLTLPLPRILALIEEFGGAAFPSRMDKTPQQMYVIPDLVEQYGFRAFDLAYAESADFFKKRWPKIKFKFFSFSNARALAQVGSRMAKVKMLTPGFPGIKELVMREGA